MSNTMDLIITRVLHDIKNWHFNRALANRHCFVVHFLMFKQQTRVQPPNVHMTQFELIVAYCSRRYINLSNIKAASNGNHHKL